MTIQAYLNRISQLAEQYAATDFVQTVELNLEPRREQQSYITGSIIFQDESVLYFKEYLDYFEGAVDKLMYSYHYQSEANRLIFRYDNARHKPELSFVEHKHQGNEILPVPPPDLADILLEIAATNDWLI